jgi:hypothetical protein
MSVIKATSLDLNKITFSDVKVDNHGRKMVYVNYNGGKIMVQTPRMYVPNGIKRWRKKDAVDNKDDSFEMEMSFGGKDKLDKNSLEINEFHSKLEQFDTLVKTNIMSHSKEWLGKSKISMDSIEEAFYAPSVRVPTDKDGNILEYPSRVRVKLDRERDGESDNFTGRFLSNKRFKTPVLMFDESKNLIEMNETNFESVAPKGSQVTAVLELVYLSITTKVSAKWKLVQARVARNEQSITGYAMLDDAEDVVQEDLDTEEDTPVVQTQSSPTLHKTVDDSVDDTVDEVEDDDEDQSVDDDNSLDNAESEPEPVPVVKPKTRVKRGVVA